MGLFRRFTDILSANLNDLVDRFENPEKMLRQAIREMEQAVATALQGAAKVLASEKLIEKQLAENRRLAEDWRERARHAVSASDETLARKALERRAELLRLTAALEDQHASTAQSGLKLRRQVDGMKARLAEAKRKLATLSARKQAADSQRTVAMVGNTGGAESAFVRFERLSDRVERDEAEAQAWEDLCGIDELDEGFNSGRDLEIDHELAALRAEASRVVVDANA